MYEYMKVFLGIQLQYKNYLILLLLHMIIFISLCASGKAKPFETHNNKILIIKMD